MNFDHIKLNKESEDFFYVQLYKEISRLIKSGEIPIHSKLPPIRKLSNLLDINTVTVVNAYKMLEEAGFIYKIVGSGCYVNNIFDYDDERSILQEGLIDFKMTSPPVELFPVEDFKNAVNDVLERDGGYAFSYHEGKGFKPLRESLALYVEAYAIKVTSEDIHIISGVQQGIDIVTKSLLAQGDYIFIESPTYAGAIGSFRMKGANIVEIPINKTGVDFVQLENEIKKYHPKLFYTIPNLHNPTGYTYSESAKKKLVELSKEYGFYILEDDYASDLFFTDVPPIPVKAYDLENRVIYLKSFSKLFMPGLRIGFMIVPKQIEDIIMIGKQTSDISTSGFMQRVLHNYLQKSKWNSQYQVIKDCIQVKFNLAAEIIKTQLPTGSVCEIPQGGINFWITLPKEIEVDLFYKELEKLKIEVASGDSFYASGEGKNSFRISIAGLPDEKITVGITEICHTIERMQREKKNRKWII